MKGFPRLMVILLTVVAGSSLTACGRNDAARQLADVSTYCDRSIAVNSALVGSSANGLPTGDQVRPEAARAALERLGPVVDEMQEAAPDAVRGDVRTAIGAIRAAATNDLDGVTAPDYEEARQNLLDFASSNCPQDSSSGDL